MKTTHSYTQRIEAPPGQVFPLLCPVRESEWLAGWREIVAVIHSDSGVAEEGCVFRTAPPGQPETVWMVTRHDPAEGVVEFVRFTAGLVVTHLRIDVAQAPNGTSSVAIRYTFTPVSEAGAAFVRENHSEDAFRRSMVWWQDSMNHWLRTGEILRTE